ncbi:MAG: sulfide/dihydroorotate dehydrogenase-like FAD/NAD-binding protein [Deltaproteobacteria bacterium]|jgi:ferredoxin--NADP+ reductase|nr:sulfide/dihydroorotate dehydrogenase-like FAD/NAD-binding protein [Deltaproteobacteria bacterium]
MPQAVLEKYALIAGQTSKIIIHAPDIARKARPGNFVMLRVTETGERFPLTIADTDHDRGTITLVYLVVGKSTALLERLEAGDELLDLCGPLGKNTAIEKSGTVICVGGGTGIAAMHHLAKGHHQAGNHVIAIIGARSKNLIFFEQELSLFCPELLISTDDGSYGTKGLVTELLIERIKKDPTISEVMAVGPVPMMEAVAKVTKPFGLKTIVSLNSIMIDGVGMCGACRVTVGGETKFTCVDGPEFDGHLVDFTELKQRLRAFREQELISINQMRQIQEAAAAVS